jgi:hypothetical protein
MASDTVPAATGATDPAHPTPAGPDTTSTGAPKGWLASAIAPVEPARPTFHLDPTTAIPAGGPDGLGPGTPAAGASSTAYHDGDTPSPDGTTSTSKNSQDKSVVRAWLLAGAERWRKGADARNKMLDIKKAKATALQVKETRSVNRSEKIVGGSTNTGSNTSNNAAKSLDNKTSKKDSGGKGGGGGSTGPAGRGGGSGSGGSAGGSRNGAGGQGSGSGKGGGRGPDKGGSNNGSGSGSGKGTGKTDTGKSGGGGAGGHKSNGAGGGSGKPGSGGSSGTSGSSGTPGKPGKDTKSPNGSSNTGKTPKAETTATCGDGSGISMTKDNKPSRKTDNTPSGSGKPSPAGGGHNTGAKNTGGPGGAGTGGAGGSGKPPAPPSAPGSGAAKPDLSKKNPDAKGGPKPSGKTTPDPKTTPKPKRVPPAPAPSGGGKPIPTQASREAGYRDGTRVGKAVAHAEAYKDGVKDGFRDTKEAAAEDKKRLDKAHQDRKNRPAPPTGKTNIPPKPTVPPKPTTPPKPATDPATPPTPKDIAGTQTSAPVPASPARTPASARKDTPVTTPTQTATPINATTVTATHVILGNSQVCARGEIRNLKQYERRLDDKADAMNHLAELAKRILAAATARNERATSLLEQARTKEAGGNVIYALIRLQEMTAIQARQASELLKRATRAAESTAVLLANVKTRYGGIYQAVCESPLTTPAELNFYDDRSTTADAL